jgi:hypothetical protein
MPVQPQVQAAQQEQLREEPGLLVVLQELVLLVPQPQLWRSALTELGCLG